MAPSDLSPTTTIIVPCYNEAGRLPADAFRAFATRQPHVRILFVNDGSTDETASVINQLAAENPASFSAMSLPRNSGKAEAVRQGFLTAFANQPKYIGFWDADLATPLDAVLEFIALLDQQPHLEMVFGSRVNLLGRSIERKRTRHYLGRLCAKTASALLGVKMYDTQCGAKLFRMSQSIADAFREPFISRWIFDIEIIARVIRSRRGTDLPPVEQIIYEHPLQSWRDVHGSKLRTSDFITITMDLTRIYWRYVMRK